MQEKKYEIPVIFQENLLLFLDALLYDADSRRQSPVQRRMSGVFCFGRMNSVIPAPAQLRPLPRQSACTKWKSLSKCAKSARAPSRITPTSSIPTDLAGVCVVIIAASSGAIP